MCLRVVTLFLVVFAALPAKADIVLSYHLSPFTGPATAPIPDNLPLGPQISSLNMVLGETKYLQIAITGNANAPQSIGGVNQSAWNGSNLLDAFGFRFNYPTTLISQPFVQPMLPNLDQNLMNAAVQQPFVSGHPNTFQFYNMGSTAITGLSISSGLSGNFGIHATSVIATFRLVATGTGTSSFSISDLNSSPTAQLFGLVDGTGLDDFVFASAHGNFPLSFQVNSVPEPSSMTMAGIVVFIGWKRLRYRKVIKVR